MRPTVVLPVPKVGSRADANPVRDFLEGDNCESNSQPFGEAALALHDLGLVVFPCGGDDGKVPSVKHWHLRKSRSTIAAWAQKFATANIAIACGPSGIVIVDVDRPELIDPMLERFGPTPLITDTPSGGAHLWYRKAGVVRSTNLRSEHLEVDVKADGGMVIVPPSFNRLSGKAYEFERGSWDDLDRLPPFCDGALARPQALTPSPLIRDKASSGMIGEGMRDDAVFYRAMLEAPHVTCEDELIALMQAFNEQRCDPPLPTSKVEQKARSAWGYEERGENWIGHGQTGVAVNAAVVDDLLSRPHGEDALALLVKLKRSHGGRAEHFAVCAKAMARDAVIAGWKDPRRYARSCKMLVAQGLITPVARARRDAQGHWTPAKYTFTDRVQ